MSPDEFYDHTLRVPSGCLIWQGAVSSSGYGNLVLDGKHTRAHRASYSLAHGPIPRGLYVLHSCDVRLCVEPSHLHLGTAKQNSREMVDRGRHTNTARLSVDEQRKVVAAYASGESQSSIGRRVGVSQATVSNIVRGKHTALGDYRIAMGGVSS